jgi:RNA polymerase sigma-70 factor (ECF subfamily)
MRVGNSYLYIEQQQRVRYLGLSLGVGYEFWRSRHWGLYASTSVVYEFPLRSTTETSYWQNDRLIDTENVSLNPHVQWSIGAGLGLQYDITPAIGLFVEPSLHYYFRNSDGISTWRSDHTFTPLLPLGIRISF